jgi:hypothetical protein
MDFPIYTPAPKDPSFVHLKHDPCAERFTFSGREKCFDETDKNVHYVLTQLTSNNSIYKSFVFRPPLSQAEALTSIEDWFNEFMDLEYYNTFHKFHMVYDKMTYEQFCQENKTKTPKRWMLLSDCIYFDAFEPYATNYFVMFLGS